MRSWNWLNQDEEVIVRGALNAVADGPFARLPRRYLFVDQSLLEEVRNAWPGPATDPEDTIHVVSRALSIVSDNHAHWWTWPQFFVAEPLVVRAFSNEWCHRYGDGTDCVKWAPGSELSDAEITTVERTVRRVVQRDLAGFAFDDPGITDQPERFFEEADADGYGPGTFEAPPGDPSTWNVDETFMIHERKHVRTVGVDIRLYDARGGETDFMLMFSIDVGGFPEVVLGQLHVT